MATPVIMPPVLKIKRSTQAGTYAMAAGAAWVVMYSENCTQAYLFCGAIIDISNMIAGDDVDIRIRKQMFNGAGFINHDQVNYLGAPPATHPTVYIAPIPDVYGVEISARQNVGVLISLNIEPYDAKRLGLP